MRISPRFWIILALAATIAARAHATDNAAEKTLQADLLKQTVFLRGFNGDAIVHKHWDGTSFVEDAAPLFREMVALNVKSVKVTDGAVKIRGQRLLPMQNGKGVTVMQDALQDGELDVTFSPADADTVLPILKDRLFFFTLQDAIAGLPKSVHHELAVRFGFEQEVLDPPPCDCTACPDESGKHVSGLTPATLTKKEFPTLTEEAKHLGIFSAMTEVGFQLTAQAEKRNIWILVAAPAKLDIASDSVIEKFVFTPAACHDVPKAVNLFIRVTFKGY